MAQRKMTLEALANTPYSYAQLLKLGISAEQIKRFLRQGSLFRLSRGIYQKAEGDLADEEQFISATLRVGSPSAICLLSALVFYHLTDEIPKKVWILVPLNKRTFHRDLRLSRSREPRWNMGIIKENGYSITNLERTLVECLVHKNLRFPIATAALRQALREKKTTLNKVVTMANQLKLQHRIQSIIVALA